MTLRHSRRRRQGVTRGDVVVLLLLIGATAMLVLMGLSRAREDARLAGCTRNLSQIGFALALYDQMHGHLPEIAARRSRRACRRPKDRRDRSRLLLEALDIPDLTELRDPEDAAEGPSRAGPGRDAGPRASSVPAIRMPSRDDCRLPSATGP